MYLFSYSKLEDESNQVKTDFSKLMGENEKLINELEQTNHFKSRNFENGLYLYLM